MLNKNLIQILGLLIVSLFVSNGVDPMNTQELVDISVETQQSPTSQPSSDGPLYENGTIIFRRLSKSSTREEWIYEYFLSDGNGKIQFLNYFRGAPAWSPDGELLAVNCKDNVMEICIYFTDPFPDNLRDNLYYSPTQRFVIYKKIPLPAECDGLVSQYGLDSISWSYDASKLSIICGDSWSYTRPATRKLCIIPLNGEEKKCLEDKENLIANADWSPQEDVLLITKGIGRGKIYLAKPDGAIIKYLTEGISATWSPDGEYIAFIKNSGSNIYKMKKDGTGEENLYSHNYDIVDEEYDYTESIRKFGFSCYGGCRMSWSPDGEKIVFQAEFSGMGTYQIFIVDIGTQELICISQFERYNYNYEPDWGPSIE